MGSWEKHRIIAFENTSALTTAYGILASGWLTEEIDVKNLNEVLLELDITKGDATQATFKILSGDAGEAADSLAELYRISGGGSLLPLELVAALSSNTKMVFRLDTAALAMIRLSGKVDVGTSNPAAVLRVLGENGTR